MYSYGSPHTAAQKQDDQHERTFSSYVRIQVVVLKTCLGRWTIGRSGERGSGISVLPARYDDDDDIWFSLVVFFCFVFVFFCKSTEPRLEPCWSILFIDPLCLMCVWWAKQFHEPKSGSGHGCRVIAWTRLQISLLFIHKNGFSINYPRRLICH